jgi:hypothetical protein
MSEPPGSPPPGYGQQGYPGSGQPGYPAYRAGAVRYAHQAKVRGQLALLIGIAVFVLWIALAATLVNNASSP